MSVRRLKVWKNSIESGFQSAFYLILMFDSLAAGVAGVMNRPQNRSAGLHSQDVSEHVVTTPSSGSLTSSARLGTGRLDNGNRGGGDGGGSGDLGSKGISAELQGSKRLRGSGKGGVASPSYKILQGLSDLSDPQSVDVRPPPAYTFQAVFK